MSAFEALKKNRSKSLEKLADQLGKMKQGGGNGSSADDRYWKPTRGADGNGMAIIRFLPAPAGEDLPFVQIWSHGFQGPTGQWYIENSLTTLGKDDPVSDHNRELWNSGIESNKELVRKQKRRLQYVANVYIVKDPGNPANEGKVFLFSFGKKIFDKLNDLMNPQFEDEDPINPFDIFDGANFRLKIRMFEGYPNYDKSEFDKSSPLHEDETVMEQIYDKAHSLKELLDEKNFKSYDVLQEKLNRVLGLSGAAPARAKPAADDGDDELSYKPRQQREAPAREEKEVKPKSAPAVSADEDDDELAYFRNLANED